MNTSSKIWEELREKRACKGILRLRVEPDSACGMYVAIDKVREILCFIVEVDTEALPSKDLFNSPVGYSSVVNIKGNKARIILQCSSPAGNEMFSAMVNDLIDCVSKKKTQAQCIKELGARLRQWQEFMKIHGVKGLNENEQHGLFGELAFIEKTLIPLIGVLDGVNSWAGPEGKNQDFHIEGIAVEVKTTSMNPHETIHISNAGQLDSTGVNIFYLLHTALDIRRGKQNTLPAIVKRIRQLCAEEGAEPTKVFEDRLRKYGYIDEQADLYAHTDYTIRKNQFYIVKEGFPRLTHSSVPEGVGDLKYSIVVSSCAQFKIGEAVVNTSIRER